MTEASDSRLITGALSMVRLSAWGLHGNVVELVRLLTIDDPADWVLLSRYAVADWIGADDRYARRLLNELVDLYRVLERIPGAGNRPAQYRFRDPRQWRHVPWRFESAAGDPRPPELVRRRLDGLLVRTSSPRQPVVARYSALQKPFVARQGATTGSGLRRDPSAPQTDDSPSSSESGGFGFDGGPQTRERKTEEAGGAGPGEMSLTGAAEAVRRAILRTGNGPVKGKLLRKLAHAFEGVPVDLLGPIVQAMERSGRNGQLPPALVDQAVAMLDAGVCSIRPDYESRTPMAAAAELQLRRDELRRDLEAARREGDLAMVEIFTRQLQSCQDRLDHITREAAS